MPTFPAVNSGAASLGGSVFSALAPRIASLTGETYPFHIGDTWMDPPPVARWDGAIEAKAGSPHRYANPRGLAPLVEAIQHKVRTRNGLPVESASEVLVTTGATGALHAAASATLEPGDEVLLLTPYWPLIRGIVLRAGGVPVEVPVLHRPLVGEALTASSLIGALDARLTERTAAVYVNSPCNPTGGVLDEALLRALGGWARDKGLWIWSDEVYEDYVFEGEHFSVGAAFPERTLTAFSFSKSMGMTGYRTGYLTGPTEAIDTARKVVTYAWYSAPTPGQYRALAALGGASEWVDRARESYRTVGAEAARRLGVAAPRGSTFLFLDVASRLDDRGLMGFMEDCLDQNVIVAPGGSFGADFGTWIRVCFTCVDPERTLRGIDRLAALVASD